MYVSIVSRRNKKCTAKATEGESTSTINEKHMNTGPQKPGLRSTASWTLQQMLKIFILSFHAGIAGGRLLGSCFCSATDCIPRFPKKLSFRAVERLWICRPGFTYGSYRQCCTTFSSCILGILEQSVSGTMDRKTWTNSMACSLLWFNFLTVSSLGDI